MDVDTAAVTLRAAAKFINRDKQALPGRRSRRSSGSGRPSDGGGSEGGSGGERGRAVSRSFAAAMQLLKAAGGQQQGRLLQLLGDGPTSMLVLSGIQPAKLPPGGSSSSSSSSSSSGGGGGTGGAIPAPTTELQLDGLAVQLEGSTLRVVMLEVVSSGAGE